MRAVRILLARIRGAFGSGRLDADVNDEGRAHLDLLAADHERSGMTPAEAHLAARRAFGGLEPMKEAYRDRRGLPWVDDGRRDAAYAVRAFVRNPTFAAVSVLTLAVGIGATTAIFSVVNAVLLQPLPYPSPDRLVRIVANIPAAESRSGAAMRRPVMNRDEFDWWRTRTKTLSHMAAAINDTKTMITAEGTVRLSGARVSPALFEMLGVRPLLGRALNPDEERAEAGAIVISSSTWRRYFGSDGSVVGRTMVLDGRSYVIVGVMPPVRGSRTVECVCSRR
jgi:hypothetical protein